jgi:hypothetical protein
MRIIGRAEWGARPARSRHVIDTPTPELWLHHSAGALDAGGNGVWWDDVRGIQRYHVDGRGWSDIAYSFLVGGGLIFEGRGVGIAGGHTKGHNTISHAICLIGNYDWMTATPEDLAAIGWLVGEGRRRGWWVDLSGGHGDASGASTACPGRHLEAAIPTIRAAGTPAPPIPQEDDDVATIYWLKGSNGNHAHIVSGVTAHYLDVADLARWRSWQAQEVRDPVPPSQFAVLDGPLRNAG